MEGIQEAIFGSLHHTVSPVIENIRQIDLWSLFQFNDGLGLFYSGKWNVYHKTPFAGVVGGVLRPPKHEGQHHMVQLNRQNLLIWNNHIFHFRPIRLWLHGHHLYFPEGSRVNTAWCQTPGPAEMKCLRGWTQKCNCQELLTSPVWEKF